MVPFLLGLLTTRSEHLDSRHIMPEAHLTGSPYSASSGSHFGQVRVSACAGEATVKVLKTIPIAMMRPISVFPMLPYVKRAMDWGIFASM